MRALCDQRHRSVPTANIGWRPALVPQDCSRRRRPLFTGPRNCGNRKRRWVLFLQDVRRVSFDRAPICEICAHLSPCPRSDQSYDGQPLVNRNCSRSGHILPRVYTMKPIALSKQANEAMRCAGRARIWASVWRANLFATNDQRACYAPVSIATAGFLPSLGRRSRTSMVSGTSASKRSRHIGRNLRETRNRTGKRCAGDRQGALRR